VTPSVDHLLTTVTIDWTTVLPDAVRLLDWSPQGRLLAIAANGSALVEDPDRVTAPMTPDPCDAVWLGECALAVVGPLDGLVTAGFDRVRPLPFRGARRVETHGGRTVVAGDGRLAVFGHLGIDDTPEIIWTGIGVSHACAHVGGTMWVLGGTGGLATSRLPYWFPTTRIFSRFRNDLIEHHDLESLVVEGTLSDVEIHDGVARCDVTWQVGDRRSTHHPFGHRNRCRG
jgi:hypothetical protein